MVEAETIGALWLALVGAGHHPDRLQSLMARADDTAPWYFYFEDGVGGSRIGKVTHEFTSSQQISDEIEACRLLIEAHNNGDANGAGI